MMQRHLPTFFFNWVYTSEKPCYHICGSQFESKGGDSDGRNKADLRGRGFDENPWR